MFRFQNLKIAMRFLRSKRYGALARFMSMASTTGIAAGVCALIIGLSAMNGFEYELHNRVLSLIPAATLNSQEDEFSHLEDDLQTLVQTPGIIAAAPTVTLEGVFSKNQSFAPSALIGIDPKLEKNVVNLERFMSCSVDKLNIDDDNFPLIIGNGILKKLNLHIGDLVDLITIDKSSNENPLSRPANATFKIVGVIKTGGQIDSTLAFTHIDKAVSLASLKAPNSIHIKTQNMLNVDESLNLALPKLKDLVTTSTWMKSQGKLYNDIQLIRNIMYLAMILVMAVACFNIISNLIMSVSEKSREIAILLTMGMPRANIIKIFTLMGVLSALRGTIIGLVLGCSLAFFITPITSNFEKYFGFELLNENIYFINFIPSSLSLIDVLLVTICSLVMSLLAALYPAFKASRIDPASELSI
ncbi:MAG: lipoprotein-releasing ABC transporter permease subunit [Succinatimonas sp.]|nr:lipoprotein-releasing ABC transporter permease subunit [Succinatimonas sp.]